MAEYEDLLREVPLDVDGSSTLEEHEEIRETADSWFCSRAILTTLRSQHLAYEDKGDGTVEIRKSQVTHRELTNARIRYYDLSTWIELLEGLTFPSHLFTLSRDQMSALARCVDSKHFDGEQVSHLKQQLATVMDGNTKWFVKLASVSPKDLQRKLSATTPTQVLELLCASNRTGDVIQSAAKNGKVDGQHNTIVLREFVPCDERLEFRMFVFEHRVTAISQYIWNEAFSILQDASEMVEWKHEMIRYWNDQLKPALSSTGVDRWVVDVLRRPDGSFFAIEINAFGADLRTGGCLFHWQLDYDVIHNTRDDSCQLRICTGGSIESGFLSLRIL